MSEIQANFKTADEAPDNPYDLFDNWFARAQQSEPRDPNAMSVATVAADGMPQVRIVLLKGHDQDGFVFYTNTTSRKGQALAVHPQAALCFFWKSIGCQIRVEGDVVPVTAAEADAYFASRARGSRVGAWASKQSQELSARSELESRVEEFDAKFEGDDVPRPEIWSGYRVKPRRIEFWQEGQFRLHTRVVYTPGADGKGWDRKMLYP